MTSFGCVAANPALAVGELYVLVGTPHEREALAAGCELERREMQHGELGFQILDDGGCPAADVAGGEIDNLDQAIGSQ
jgi:hypothetical protein